jgi:carbon monoxide dehydrogenase subunit G
VKLAYSGQERVAAAPDAAWAFICDPHRLGPCLPDVQEVRVADATHFEAVVKVAVGLVRGKFTFKLTLVPDDAARRLTINATGGGMGSAVDLVAHAAISPAAEGAGSLLDWDGEASMRGPVAAVGGRVLDRQAQKLVEQTFVNVRSALAGGG